MEVTNSQVSQALDIDIEYKKGLKGILT